MPTPPAEQQGGCAAFSLVVANLFRKKPSKATGAVPAASPKRGALPDGSRRQRGSAPLFVGDSAAFAPSQNPPPPFDFVPRPDDDAAAAATVAEEASPGGQAAKSLLRSRALTAPTPDAAAQPSSSPRGKSPRRDPSAARAAAFATNSDAAGSAAQSAPAVSPEKSAQAAIAPIARPLGAAPAGATFDNFKFGAIYLAGTKWGWPQASRYSEALAESVAAVLSTEAALCRQRPQLSPLTRTEVFALHFVLSNSDAMEHVNSFLHQRSVAAGAAVAPDVDPFDDNWSQEPSTEANLAIVVQGALLKLMARRSVDGVPFMYAPRAPASFATGAAPLAPHRLPHWPGFIKGSLIARRTDGSVRFDFPLGYGPVDVTAFAAPLRQPPQQQDETPVVMMLPARVAVAPGRPRRSGGEAIALAAPPAV